MGELHRFSDYDYDNDNERQSLAGICPQSSRLKQCVDARQHDWPNGRHRDGR
jgi:hypothetical protein